MFESHLPDNPGPCLEVDGETGDGGERAMYLSGARAMRPVTRALVVCSAVVFVAVAVVLADRQSAAAGSRCFGRSATIVGTPGDDDLQGTPDRDIIIGLAGDDMIEGLGDLDRICGGDGDDVLRGNRDKDFLDGQGGRDRVLGGGENDNARGGGGRDRVVGGSGHDAVSGGSGRDRLRGGPGQDRLSGFEGRDLLDGSAGHDLVTYFDSGPVGVDLASGISSGHGHDRLVSIEDAQGSNSTTR